MRNRIVIVVFGAAVLVAAYAASGERHEKTSATAKVDDVIVQVQTPSGVIIPVAGIHQQDLHDNFLDARTGHVHNALDIMAPRGTPVLAAVDGTVRKLFTSRAGGITIYEFDRAQEKVYYYAHLDRYADGLEEGDAIARGAVIGYVGTTGNAPVNSPHLHFAIEILPPTKEWWKGTAVDPFPILTAR
jgi:murein DD-endopeptidase MepM/ murein hydrolase activator NlpD